MWLFSEPRLHPTTHVSDYSAVSPLTWGLHRIPEGFDGNFSFPVPSSTSASNVVDEIDKDGFHCSQHVIQ